MFEKEILEQTKRQEREWRERVQKRYQGKEFKALTSSGIEVKSTYSIGDMEGVRHEDIGLPGEYPFTRGIFPIHYQYQPWINEQVIGYGTTSMLRDRIKVLQEVGGARGYFGAESYNLIPDQGGCNGYDPDDPVVMGRVGDTGVSICKTSDFQVLFGDKDMTRTRVSLICNNSSPGWMALYLAAMERLGFPFNKLSGSLTNYLYCKPIAYDSETFPPQSAFKIMREIIKYCTRNVPLWNTITFTEHNTEQRGATPVQAIAFNLSASIALTEECIKAGLRADDFVSRFGFHVQYGDSFFEDVAKTRALRRMFARINKERFDCQNPRAMQARIFGQTAGINMTVQQPLNNLIRNTIGAMSMIMAGVNSTQVDCYDEALAEPTEQSVTLAMRTLQIIEHETGIPQVTDPMAGSYYVEWLTNEIERKAYEVLSEIDRRGGYIKCWENGWFQEQITQAAYKWRQQVESGEKVIVGVNKYIQADEKEVEVFQTHPDAEKMAIEEVRRHREQRDNARTKAALDNLRKEAMRVKQSETEGELMEAMIQAARDDATLGEMTGVLREVFGII